MLYNTLTYCLASKAEFSCNVSVNNICFESCPSSYIQQQKACIQENPILVKLKFYDSSGDYNILSASKAQVLSTPKIKTPVFLNQQGLYFKKDSFLTLDKEIYSFGPKVTLALWFQSFESGQVFAASDTISISIDQTISLSLKRPEKFILMNTQSAGNWNRVVCEINFVTLSSGRILLMSDIEYESFEFENFKFSKNWNKIVFKFGDFLENGSGFKGLVYAFEAFNAIKIPITEFELPYIRIHDIFLDNCENEEYLESYHSGVKHEIRKLATCDSSCLGCDLFGNCWCNTNYYLSNNKCFLCDSSCLTCSGPLTTNCYTCKSLMFLTLNNQCTCNNYYYWTGLLCSSCNPTCVTCSGSSSSNCLTCPTNAALNSNKQCVCNNYYYWTGTQCSSCDGTCLTCSGSSSSNCLTCATNAALNGSNQCVCNTGFYWVGTQCSSCDATCKTCSGSSSSNCLTCPTNGALNSNHQCVCNNGYYWSGTQCALCDATCLTCSGSSSANCLTCLTNAALNTNHQCMCNTYFYWTGINCASCDSTCVTCSTSSSSGCLTCPTNSALNSNHQCVCITSYYWTGTQCSSCDLTCVTCSGSSSFNCLTCSTNAALNSNHQCTCSINYYWAGTYCASCDSTCLTCSGSSSSNCLTCFTNAGLNSNHQCVCNNEYYWSGTQCSSCDATCATCSGSSSSNCLTCFTNAVLNANHQCLCNTYFYWTGTQCSSCDATCVTCSGSSSSNCLTCPANSALNSNHQCVCSTGYYWTGTQCALCDSTCVTCSGSSSFDCLTCYANAALNSNNQCVCISYLYWTGTQCSSCDLTCVTCSGSSSFNCLTCYANAALNSNNQCVCNTGYYWSGTQCSICDSTCLTCSGTSSSDCLTCLTNADFNSNHQCECQNGFYWTGTQCASCDATCVTCSGSSSSNCLTCSTNAALNSNNQCVCNTIYYWTGTQCSSCDPNLTPNNQCPCNTYYYWSGTQCSSCDATCVTCSGSSSSDCVTCFTDAAFDASHQCVCNPNFYWTGTQCSLCDPTCVTCSGTSTNCLTCPTNAALNSNNHCACNIYFYWTGIACASCDLSCLTCSGSSSSNCLTCLTNAGLNSNHQCVCNNYFYWTGTQCSSCDGTCLTCSGSSSSNCLTCATNAALNGSNQCVCNTGFYWVGTQCSSCDATCKTCSGSSSSNCLTCPTNGALNSNHQCVCNNGYYWSGTQCALCDATCLTCSGLSSSNCLTCPTNAALNLNHQCECNTYFYWTGTQCSSCDATCLTCSGPSSSNCLTCPTNSVLSGNSECVCNTFFYWTGTHCSSCDPTCVTCSGSSSSECLTCNANAFLNSNYQCVCDTFYFWNTNQCSPCNNLCLFCTGSTIVECSQCISSALSYHGLCLTSCPTLFDPIAETCVNNGGTDMLKYSFYAFNPPFTDALNLMSFTGPNVEFGYYRGSLISTVSQTQNFLFTPFFSVSLWMNIDSYGTIFSKSNGVNVELQILISTANQLIVTVQTTSLAYNYQPTFTGFSLNSWFNLVILFEQSGKNTNILAYLNSVPLTSSTLNNDYPLSNKLATITIGSNSIHSWLYEFIYFTYALTSPQVSSYIGACSGCTCPFDFENCLWNCPLTQYYNGLSCVNCMLGCLTCRYSNSCSLCADSSCFYCADTVTTTCSSFCSNRCILCDPLVDGCNICSAGFVKSIENVCMVYCSLGDTPGTNNCILNPVMVFSFSFTNISNSYTYGSHSFYMGVSNSYWPNYDTHDPWIMYQRGLYFLKSQATYGNNLTPESFYLGNTHTFDMFIYVMQSNGVILSVNDGASQYLTLSVLSYASNSYQLSLDYSITNLQTTSQLTQTFTLKPGSWLRISWSLSFSSSTLNLLSYLNNQYQQTSSVHNNIYNQPNSPILTLGAFNLGSFYQGYIYKISLYNYALTSFTSTSCSCYNCTDTGDCLNICNPSQFYNGTCSLCSTSCTYGCIRGNDCKLNIDQLCEVYSSLKSCEKCVKFTLPNTLPCKCTNFSTYNLITDTCECDKNYFGYNNECYECTRWLKNSDVTASFSSNFLQINFYFSVSIQSIKCEDMFSKDTLAKFGSYFKCLFSTDWKMLIVTLGYGYTIKNEDVMLNSKNLKGAASECGYFRTTLVVNIAYSSSLPLPSALILAPSVVYYECQNLTIDGTKSYGGQLWLLYEWNIIFPQSNYFFGLGNQSIISLDRSLLSPGTITVSLLVQNKFGINDSDTITILSETSNSISIEFDETLDYSCYMSQDCLYKIKSISSCLSSTSYNITWSILKGSELSTDINKFWKKQTSDTVLKIPSRSFYPGTLQFSVLAQDLVNNVYGRTNLSITVLADDQVVILTPASGSVPTYTDLYLSANQSYDPNGISELSFKWQCLYNGAVCPYDFNDNLSTFFVPRAINKNKQFSSISLTVSRSSRKLQQSAKSTPSFIPTFVPFYCPSVSIREYFTKKQIRVALNKKPFVIEAVTSDASGYSIL